ncbi:hypothetical protein GJ744_005945 [Endocarpon pusillum]|uniref:Uncharacterized protein n=1 Tax=Endocarpon pusillum TaxID=364733 RepID=A0A8H7ATG8_9EURO|nr:hypothetical protein GJ744_005945 [Endocarpon pusillum]
MKRPGVKNSYNSVQDARLSPTGHERFARGSGEVTRRSVSPKGPQATRFLIPRKPVEIREGSVDRGSSQQIPTCRAQLLRNWWMEIGACLICIVALLAITATLYPHRHKPLPQWPYSITVNSLVAIYAVVLKAAILLVTAEGLSQLKWTWFKCGRPLEDFVKYDQASRGPLGAVNLLWRLRAQHPLSSCGALITIIVVAIDPFAQQIVRYYVCSVAVDGVQAAVPRTNLYRSNGIAIGSHIVPIQPPEQDSINAGIFSPGGVVRYECLTGNCTFPLKYNTAGYCSICEDVTHLLMFANKTTNNTGTYNNTLENVNQGICTLTTSLPSGLSMNSSALAGENNYTTMSINQDFSSGNNRWEAMCWIRGPNNRGFTNRMRRPCHEEHMAL